MTSLPEAEPLLLYVHIPFCLSKCHFCDWVTEIPVSDLRRAKGDAKREAYIAAVAQQIEAHGADQRALGKQPRILYWGGGTGTILEPDEIDQLMGAINKVFSLSGLKEATIEGSPGTLTKEKLRHFRQAGFRRLSLGVQSFHDERLRSLGRTHDAAEAMATVEDAHAAGFEDISVDLICCLPDESPAECLESVNIALRLPINHVALYPYRPAAGTTLTRKLRAGQGRLKLADQQESYRWGAARLREMGFQEYAASHFGSPRCHSDMAYFKLEMDWLGCGSGATSLLDGEFRSTRRGYLDQYLTAPLQHDECIAAAEPAIAARLVYQALTTKEGIRRDNFEARLKQPLKDILARPAVASLLETIKRIQPLHETADGLCIPEQRIASTFIDLLFMGAPEASRAVTRAQEVLGYH